MLLSNSLLKCSKIISSLQPIIYVKNKQREKTFKEPPPDFIVRNLRKKEVPQVLDLGRKNNWHKGDRSIYTLLEFDPDSFKVAVNRSEEVLAVCSAVRNTSDYYFMGHYVVKEQYRGTGIGLKVSNACLERVGHSAAGLNSKPELVELYATKGGFSVICEEQSIQQNDTTEDIIRPENLSDIVPQGVLIIPFNEFLLTCMLKFDFKICGYDRRLALELNCTEKYSNTLVAIKDGVCVGFGTVKRNIQNVPQIGPLYADNHVVAETLLRHLLLDFPIKKGLSMATFAHNHAANQLVQKIGCPPAQKLPRMYNKGILFNHSTKLVFCHFDISSTPV